MLFGDFGQLPPVMDLPLYTTAHRSFLADLGMAAYQTFNHAVVLTQVIRQSGSDSEQIKFRDILLRLREAQLTKDDWKYLMKRTHSQGITNLSSFKNALHLYPTVEFVVEHNVNTLRSTGQPVATIRAVHTGPKQSVLHQIVHQD